MVTSKNVEFDVELQWTRAIAMPSFQPRPARDANIADVRPIRATLAYGPSSYVDVSSGTVGPQWHARP